ncbi:MAG TPA: kelch repeat-containing protein [Planctomycetota bacterium]|jgi:hypothetical protein
MKQSFCIVFCWVVLRLVLLASSAHAADWTTTDSMAIVRREHTATLLPSGKVLVAGGYNTTTYYLSSAELYDPATGTWTATGSLATGRHDHTATLLLNGKVLVVGGSYGYGALSSAEVYDPATGAWTSTGSLGTARASHTATLLPNGKVLVAGGYNWNGGTYPSSAELYNPATGTWTATGSLPTARISHTATLLPSGKVLVAGGYNGAYLSGAAVYNPATGTWTSTGTMATARRYHTATLLPSGKVLVAGGLSSSSRLSSAEVYDLATGAWTSINSMAAARDWHTATLLPSGMVLIAGGTGLSSAELYDAGTGNWKSTGSLATQHYVHTATMLSSGKVLVAGGYGSSITLSSAEVYDPATSAWTGTSSLAAARYYHTATLLPNGKVLVAGGYNGSYLSSAEVYDPATGLWSATGSLVAARRSHTATLLPNGTVLVAGGWNGSSYLSSAEVYDPATGTWAATGSTLASAYQTATLLSSGKVLIAGGYNGSYLSSAEVYDPATGLWTATGPLAAARRYHTATLLLSGSVLIAGGQNGGGYLASAEVYDPGTGAWTTVSSLATARRFYTATLLPSGKVLVAGGYNGAYLSSAEVYDPATDLWTNTGLMATTRISHTATLLPSGKVLVAGGYNGSYLSGVEVYDPATGIWASAASMAFGAREVHTATLLPSGKVLVAGGSNGTWMSSAEVYGEDLGYSSSWQPTLAQATSPLSLGSSLTVSGGQFKGLSEASGSGTTSSATNYPLVQLRSLSNEQTAFLLPDPAKPWSNTSFTSKPVTGFPIGPASVTVYVNGIPSDSQVIAIVGPATRLQVEGFPSPTTAGVAGTVSVRAQDAYGNTAGYSGTIHFTSTDAQAALPGDYMFLSSDKGVHTFNVTLKTAGSWSISATDKAAGTITGTQSSITVNPAGASTLVVSGFPSPTTAGDAGDVTVRAMDLCGNTATGYSGTIHFTSTDAQAALPADYTFVPADNGVHTFSVTLKTAGSQSITATDAAAGTIAGTQSSITVNPAGASTLLVSGFPSATTAGAAGDVTVRAMDLYGNTATGYSGTIHFTSSDAQAELPADYTFLSSDKGVHTFSVTLKTTGTQSITATDTVTGTLTGTQFDITINPASGRLFVSGFPSPKTAGELGNVTVTAKDLFDNLLTGYTGTIHFTSTDGQAELPADYTFVSGDNGVHSFSVTLKIAGSQSITATDIVLGTIPGTQSDIDVNPAPASTLAVSGFPSPTTAGDAGIVTVTAKDVYANTVTGYTGTIQFASTDGLAELPADYTFVPADNGVHTFSVTLKTAGSWSITATDKTTGTITGTQSSIVVNPASACALVVSGFPSPTIAGDPGNFTVMAQDLYGNTATGYTGTIQFTSTDGRAELPADHTFVSGDNGVQTFSFTPKTTGTQSLTATDAATETIAGTQSGIVVNPAPAYTLVVSGFPSPMTAGAAGDITLTAKDAYGNTATGYTGTVSFGSTDGKALLPQDYAFVPADAGIHSFSATLKTAGNQSIVATDTAAESITGAQDNISVNSTAASTLIVSDFPSTTTAGYVGSITVTAKDPYDNTATGYRGVIQFTSTDSRAALPLPYQFQPEDGGTQTFGAALSTTGAQSITATDNIMSTINGTQSGIAVYAGLAHHLAIETQPFPQSQIGQVFAEQPAVRIEDAWDNLVESDSSTVVTAALASGPGSLLGTLTAMASGGVATFSDLACDAAGIVTLRFIGDSLLGATSGSIMIDQLSQTIAFGALTNKVFGDTPFTVSATGGASGNAVTFTIISGPATINGSEITLTGAGLVTVRASQAENTNYSAAPDVDQSFIVAKALASISLGALSQIYSGSEHPVAATTNPENLAVLILYDGQPEAPTHSGKYKVTATISDSNYFGDVSDTLVVNKAFATVTIDDATLDQVYTGTARIVTATVSPSSVWLETLYNGVVDAPLADAGTYLVEVRCGAGDYEGGDVGILVVRKKDAALSLTPADLSQVYDGNSKSVRVTTTPEGLGSVSVYYNGSTIPPTNAGTYAVYAELNNTNYRGSVSGTLLIAPKAATVALSSLEHVYDGTAKIAVATTTPSGLSTSVTYEGGSVPVNAGTYTVQAVITDSNSFGSATDTLVIAKAPQAIIFDSMADKTYGDAPFTIGATGGSSGNPITFAVIMGPATAAGVNGSTITVTGAGLVTIRASQAGNANYNAAQNVDQSFIVSKAAAAPAIDSTPTFSPAQPKAGETVAFSAIASDANGDAITYLWNFGDSTTASGSGVSHVYAAAGNYTVMLTVSDGKLSSSASASLTVAAATTGGPVLPPGEDADGDGFSDEVERTLGSNPNNASDIPGGAEKVQEKGVLSVLKLSIKLNFAKPVGNDSIGLSGLLPIPEGFTINGQVVVVDVGGVVKSFKLDLKGQSPKGNDSLAVGVKAGKTGTPLQVAKFAVKLSKGSFAAALADSGLANATTSGKLTVPVSVIFNGMLLSKSVPQAYKATKDKSGATK